MSEFIETSLFLEIKDTSSLFSWQKAASALQSWEIAAPKKIAGWKGLSPLTFGTLSLSHSTDYHYLSLKEKGNKSSEDQVNGLIGQ